MGLTLAGCAETPPIAADQPPSASDLPLLHAVRLCDRKAALLQSKLSAALQRTAWGSGEELRLPGGQSPSKADESYFFDEDGQLVGALFIFPGGRDLAPYPVLRQTLSQLPPTVEFFMSLAQGPARESLDTSVLFMTGDATTTTQYITSGRTGTETLLMASVAIDPYSSLLSPYRKEWLGRISRSHTTKSGARPVARGAEDKEPFPAVQQFARGQAAHLAYCGIRDNDIAIAAYQAALKHGFTGKQWEAEAHHKLGLALEGNGLLAQAKEEMERSLAVRPKVPEVLNNLGTVYAKMGDRARALESFEKAVTLRPNYPLARYNLAEAYEAVNKKLAISEYETYLVLAAGMPEEQERMARAKKRVEELRRP
jgi:hypothetical protein